MTGGIRLFSAGPLPVLALVLMVGIILLLIPLLIFGITGAAFMRLGLSWVAALALVLLMLLGSFINIPLCRVRRDMIRARPLDSFGNEPSSDPSSPGFWDTTISVNLGGAIVPVGIAAYMMYRGLTIAGTPLLLPVSLCALLVSAVSFVSTHEVPGSGIRVPLLLPALAALLAGLFLSPGAGMTAAVTALAGGTIGTLAGGNLAHLYRVRDLEVPEVSIGGHGTFGAVFLCCLLPALIA